VTRSALAAARAIASQPEASRPRGLWTQQQAADYLGVSTRYLRASGCPKVLLPGNGPKEQPLVRYRPADVEAWLQAWHTERPPLRRA